MKLASAASDAPTPQDAFLTVIEVGASENAFATALFKSEVVAFDVPAFGPDGFSAGVTGVTGGFASSVVGVAPSASVSFSGIESPPSSSPPTVGWSSCPPVGDCASGFQRHVDPFGVEAEVDGLADIWLAGGHGEDLTGLPVSKFAWIVYAERL